MVRPFPIGSRELSRLLTTLFALLVLWGGSPVYSEPLGRLIWTERNGNDFSLHTYLYAPPGIPGDLYNDGPILIDDDYLMLLAEKEATKKANGMPLQSTGTVAPDSPKASLRFLHPSLDFTGKRILFTGGDTWGPELKESHGPQNVTGTAVSGGTAIFFGRHDDSQKISDPPSDGSAMDAYPLMDQEGRFVYFSRFHYKVEDGNPPGWYLMRTPRESADAGTAGDEEYLEAGGGRVMGYQATIDSTGQYLVFVQSDPKNIGSDLYVLDLTDLSAAPTLLVNGENGESGTFTVPEAAGDRDLWLKYEVLQGRARISRPSITSDGRFLVYACDRDGDWDIYSVELERSGGVLATVGAETRVEPGSDDPSEKTDEMWPSVSGDGHYVAFMSNREEAAPGGAKTAQGKTRIWIAGFEAGGGTAGDVKLVANPSGETEQMWPVWDQDEDPPHLQIVLQTSGGGEPTKFEILDQNPDPLPGSSGSTGSVGATDVVSLSMHMADYYPGAPPPGGGAGFDPIRFGFNGDKPPVHIEYGVKSPGDMTEVGRNPFSGPQVVRGNSFHLLLSKKRESLGLHRGLGELKVTYEGSDLSGPPAAPGDPSTIVDDEFDGMYLFENQRLAITVLARDNRWLRVGPKTSAQKALYTKDLLVEGAELRGEDKRSLQDGPADPPYLRVRQPEDLFERNYPGVAWWIEEGPRYADADGKEESKIEAARHKNASFIVFRFANYPPDQYAGDSSRNKDIYLRVVAKDLIGNMTDVRIPLHIRGKDFNVNTIQSGTQRGSQ